MHDALQALLQRSVLPALAAFATTVLVLLILAPLARRIGLVDHPGGRKTHAAATPLIGGAAILIGAVPIALATFDLTPNILGLMAAGAVVIAAGLADDIYDLRWYWRFLAQGAAALLMIFIGGVQIEELGPLFGKHIESLGLLSIPFTVLATIGLMNALNMIDGVDGLAGGVTGAALLMLVAAAVYSGNARLAHGLIILLGALAAFLLFNMRSPWRSRASVFLGNAGSEFLGLVVAWCCIRLTQNHDHPVTPALAPFLLAPPVIDCLTVMVRRIRNGRSPFSADRNHMHHIMLDAGYSTTAAVAVIVAFSFAMGLGAALAMLAHVKPIWLVTAFVGITFVYYVLSAKRERCVRVLKSARRLVGARPSRVGAEDSVMERSR